MKEKRTVNSANDFVEAIAFSAVDTDSSAACSWLSDRGFETIPMRAGFLITGTVATFEEFFRVTLGDRSSRLSLPVPEELREQVDSITVRELPDYLQE